jgi:hypothetical protein
VPGSLQVPNILNAKNNDQVQFENTKKEKLNLEEQRKKEAKKKTKPQQFGNTTAIAYIPASKLEEAGNLNPWRSVSFSATAVVIFLARVLAASMALR